MQASDINKQLDQFVGNFNLEYSESVASNVSQPSSTKNSSTIFSRSPKAFKIILLTLGLISFTSGLSVTFFALAPDDLDLQRQEVLDQRFSTVATQQANEIIR